MSYEKDINCFICSDIWWRRAINPISHQQTNYVPCLQHSLLLLITLSSFSGTRDDSLRIKQVSLYSVWSSVYSWRYKCVWTRWHGTNDRSWSVLRTTLWFHGTVKHSFPRPEDVDPFIHTDEATACWVYHPPCPVLLRFRDLREQQLFLNHWAQRGMFSVSVLSHVLPLCGWQRYAVHHFPRRMTFMVPRGWILITVTILWLPLFSEGDICCLLVELYSKYWIDYHEIRCRCWLSQEDEIL